MTRLCPNLEATDVHTDASVSVAIFDGIAAMLSTYVHQAGLTDLVGRPPPPAILMLTTRSFPCSSGSEVAEKHAAGVSRSERD